MAQVERVKEQRADKKRLSAGQANSGLGGRLVSFSPNDSQKQAIREMSVPFEDHLLFLETVLQDGHRISLQYQENYDSYSMIVRDGNDHWDRAVAVSFWHRDLSMVFRITHYALSVVFPDFPAGVNVPTRNTPDW